MSGWPQEPVTSALIEEWSVIDGLLADLDEGQWLTPSTLPGWTVHDVVAHVIGTESLLAGIEAPAVTVDVRALPHVRNEIAAFNEQWVEGLRGTSNSDLLARFREITAQRSAALIALSAADWDAQAQTPVGLAPYGRFMRIRAMDCWMHELDIRDSIGVPGSEDGAVAEFAISEISSSLGFVVGKKGKAPDGARITFDLGGAVVREIHVAVDGRASVVETLDAPATTTIAMPSQLFARITGGRVPVRDHLDAITVSGDTEVGDRIVENLKFMI